MGKRERERERGTREEKKLTSKVIEGFENTKTQKKKKEVVPAFFGLAAGEVEKRVLVWGC